MGHGDLLPCASTGYWRCWQRLATWNTGAPVVAVVSSSKLSMSDTSSAKAIPRQVWSLSSLKLLVRAVNARLYSTAGQFSWSCGPVATMSLAASFFFFFFFFSRSWPKRQQHAWLYGPKQAWRPCIDHCYQISAFWSLTVNSHYWYPPSGIFLTKF